MALVLLPALVLAGIELALRLAGYGYPTGFFRQFRADRPDLRVNNEAFSRSFLPPSLARLSAPILMEAAKPTNTFRLFILGESAAQGDPEPAFGAGRYLEALLRERFPGQKFEVINVAITAINSHAVLPIARECARYHGDLWIVYMGNNEMVGPFGAATAFGAPTLPRWVVRCGLAIQQTRTGQLITALARTLTGNDGNAGWRGMKMFLGHELRPDDGRKAVVYRNFQGNLHDILRAGLDSGAHIVLSTVAVNLKDCPPFASLSNSNLPPVERARCDQLAMDGSQAATQGRYQAAADCFGRAAALDPLRAELPFRQGECLLHSTNSAAARESFQRACDNDALPFRADSRINRLIAEAGRQFAGKRLTMCDAAAALADGDAPGIPGEEVFYEHVHFNFDGSYRLARAWADGIERLLPGTTTRGPGTGWAAQNVCERRLGLTDWHRLSVFESMLSRLQEEPLNLQLNHTRRREQLEDQVRQIRRRMEAAPADQVREVYRDSLERNPGDYWLHQNFAQYLESVGDFGPALTEWRLAREWMPPNPLAWFREGHLLAAQGQTEQARACLLQALAWHPGYVLARVELGNLHFAAAEYELALQEYGRAHRLWPMESSICCFMGRALSRLGRHDEAIDRYREAVGLQPDSSEAHFGLGQELVFQKRFPEAQSEYEKAIQLQPEHVGAHYLLGLVQARLGRPDEALRQFNETLRLDPGNTLARDQINRIRKQPEHTR
jgi:tetratricopeptide (TPR) repeat protein